MEFSSKVGGFTDRRFDGCMKRSRKPALPKYVEERTKLWHRPAPPRRAWEHSPLAPVSARPPLTEYLHQLWDRRHFIQLYARSQALGEHQGTLLGQAWFVLAPLLDGLVYWLIFGVAFNLHRTVPDFVPRLLIGILLFRYFSRCLTSMARSLASGRGLIRAFSFPRASLPISAMIRESLSLVPLSVVLLGLLLLVPPRATPSSTWLLFPLPLLLVAMFTAGAGLVLARVVSIVPDVANILGYLLRFTMYGSGVIFSVARFSDHPTVLALMTSNPVYIFIEMMRDLLLYDSIPAPGRWLLFTGWAVPSLIIGVVFFWRGEPNYGKQRGI